MVNSTIGDRVVSTLEQETGRHRMIGGHRKTQGEPQKGTERHLKTPETTLEDTENLGSQRKTQEYTENKGADEDTNRTQEEAGRIKKTERHKKIEEVRKKRKTQEDTGRHRKTYEDTDRQRKTQ